MSRAERATIMHPQDRRLDAARRQEDKQYLQQHGHSTLFNRLVQRNGTL